MNTNSNSLFILIAVFSVARLSAIEQLPVGERLKDIFSDKCAHNSQSFFAAFELLIASNRLEECVPMFTLTANVSDQIDEFCRLVQMRGYKRVKTFAKKLTHCLEEEEKFLGDFITTGFNATFENLCGDNALNVSEIAETFLNSNCSDTSAQLGEILNTNCLINLKFFETLNSTRFVLRQEDVCGDMMSIKDCLDENIQQQCGGGYSNILSKVFEPFLSWCRENTPQDENLVR